ncbi:hydrolase [Xylariaceae sp. FL0594]|nr:hydrolase [Xylariaceae sp. FL0594]
MVKTVEGTFELDDGASLYTKSWFPEENESKLRARMVMIHGFNDHVDRYYGLFPYLAARGIAVHGLDQRGWGRSVRTSADRGRTGPTARVLADMAAFIRSVLSLSSPVPVPVFVLGHSMGGGQVLTLASTPSYSSLVRQLRGLILESPFLGFAPELQPSRLTIVSGRLASHLLPHFQLHRPIPPEDVTRDVAVQQSIRDDPLMHEHGTLEGLAGMLDRTDALASGKLALERGVVRSLFMAHGDADKVTSFERSREWFDRECGSGGGSVAVQGERKVPDATFKNYKGFAHQLHADPGKEEFYEDVANWILQRCDDDNSASAGKGEGKVQPHL